MTERNEEDRETVPTPEPLKALSRMSDLEVRAELFELLGMEGMINERKVMLYMARRYFRLGAANYRALQLHDGRDNVEECLQEGSDLMFYAAKNVLESEG